MPRPSKPILSRRGIAEEALAFVEEEGMEALTTRRRAKRLGVEGPSLYNHITSPPRCVRRAPRTSTISASSSGSRPFPPRSG